MLNGFDWIMVINVLKSIRFIECWRVDSFEDTIYRSAVSVKSILKISLKVHVESELIDIGT